LKSTGLNHSDIMTVKGSTMITTVIALSCEQV